jgi:hypothetical protein
MRRNQPLSQCAAFYLTPIEVFQTHSRDTQQRTLRFAPSLLLQLAVLLLLAAFFSGTRLHAQTGSITGTVIDPFRSTICGAQVQTRSQATIDLTCEATPEVSANYAH